MSFRPCGAGKHTTGTVALNLDELEAIRLADHEGLYQEQAAEKMKISRQTFGNIIVSAHRKIADFLVNSKQLTVGGGAVEISQCKFICRACQHPWSVPCGTGRPTECPQCNSTDLICAKKANQGTNHNTCWRDL